MAVKTILLRGHLFTRKELQAAAAVTPGYLCERASATTVQKHSGAGLNAAKMFALENEVVGGEIDTDYATGDNVLLAVCAPGTEVYALVAAAATAITVGAALESAGDGTLRLATVDAATDDTQRDSVVAYAIEAVNNSGGGAEARIKVEVA